MPASIPLLFASGVPPAGVRLIARELHERLGGARRPFAHRRRPGLLLTVDTTIG